MVRGSRLEFRSRSQLVADWIGMPPGRGSGHGYCLSRTGSGFFHLEVAAAVMVCRDGIRCEALSIYATAPRGFSDYSVANLCDLSGILNHARLVKCVLADTRYQPQVERPPSSALAPRTPHVYDRGNEDGVDMPKLRVRDMNSSCFAKIIVCGVCA